MNQNNPYGASLTGWYYLVFVLFAVAVLSAIAPSVGAQVGNVSAFTKCVEEKLLGVLGIVLVTQIVSIIVEKGLSELAERAGSELLEKLAKKLGKKLIPWVGAILVIIDLLIMLDECLAKFFGIGDSIVKWIIEQVTGG